MKEIREIISKYEQTDFEKESIALASVVNVEESSYRRIGARMLVSSNGNWIGGISGGCLEGDALRRSQKAIFSKTPSRVVYDTMDDDDNQIGVGLGCNGRIVVLLTPIDPDDSNNPIEKLKTIVALNRQVVMVTIINSEKEAKLGKSFVYQEEKNGDDILGLDEKALRENIELITSKKRSQLFKMKDGEGEMVELLFEFIRPEMRLIIVGDNYDVSALVGIVHELGWEIYIVGRKKKIHKSTFQKAKAVYEYEEFEDVPMDDYTSVLLMTHDYNWDKKILEKIIKLDVPYVGMLGPKKRLQKMEGESGLENLSFLPYFHSPIGLDIGAESPEEIAISILSEILAVFRKRDGQQLKHREGTIHERHP
jgi:xanthine/CO dehydrogenase XdhC/CoxF family maturation factor